ncbi:hypothetical protein TBLA_0E03350 [Henningerozyma blattae CBS 6284]|uniref:Deacetylase sirtuin-type domain-containing protein n=1 Tax=Henningerozyma blattae (strain ATCC 34711 / CBS 6284 / DSM 70876 / NBRC 10599 / NRRL Y-10934 / UCD 77-7) TaxID=1071380 RepID=I2H4T7_HENB6|nr:hypothetical protein TBLA_0E03350 [Tetrapisispora blattae CBS 6284]CCH61389.1 hypothetical protein TBLA_0E03350 [Tetrapisispora blattae CBS 6284]
MNPFVDNDLESDETPQLIQIKTLHNNDPHLSLISKKIFKSNNNRIVMLTGAGISCNAGIPDFRSATGLYNAVRKQYPHLLIKSGQDLFDISLFRDEDSIAAFASFMEKLYSCTCKARPTETHKFIALLRDKQKLLRCYTQNIDGLESLLNLQSSTDSEFDLNVIKGFRKIWNNLDIIKLHGDLNSLCCTKCYTSTKWTNSNITQFKNGELPNCSKCERANNDRINRGKRSLGKCGVLRPNIVLYGENHPSGEVIAKGLHIDVTSTYPDIFIIMGTSLKVDGVKKLVKQMSKRVHDRNGIVILVNKTDLPLSTWKGVIDYHIKTNCDQWVEFLKKQEPTFFNSSTISESHPKLLGVVKRELKQTQIPQSPPATPAKERSPTLCIPSKHKNSLPLTPTSDYEGSCKKSYYSPKRVRKSSPLKKKHDSKYHLSPSYNKRGTSLTTGVAIRTRSATALLEKLQKEATDAVQ